MFTRLFWLDWINLIREDHVVTAHLTPGEAASFLIDTATIPCSTRASDLSAVSRSLLRPIQPRPQCHDHFHIPTSHVPARMTQFLTHPPNGYRKNSLRGRKARQRPLSLKRTQMKKKSPSILGRLARISRYIHLNNYYTVKIVIRSNVRDV